MSTSSSSGTVLRRHDRLDTFWHLASSGPVTLALCLLLVATLALAAIFPQLPVGLDSAATERWLGAAAAPYRGVGAALLIIGVFTILEGLWLRIVMALLAYNLALRLAHQLRRLWEGWRPVLLPPPYPPGLPSHHITLAATAQVGLEAVQASMQARYGVRASTVETGQARVYGRRGRAGTIGALLMTLGPLLLLAGLVVNDVAGWRTSEIALAMNGSASLSVTPGLRILLNDIEGEGLHTTALLTVIRSDGRQAQLRAGYLRPAHWGNLWIIQLTTGPALEARALSGGQPLLLQALTAGGPVSDEIRTPFRQTPSEQAFAIPARNLTVRVVSYGALPEHGIQGPVFLVEAYRGDDPTPLVTQFVEKQATFSVDDVTVDLRRERHAVLSAAYLPGALLLALGGLLLAAGGLLVLGWGNMETWAHLIFEEDATGVTFHTAAPLRGRTEAHRLARAAEAWAAGHAERAPAAVQAAAGADLGAENPAQAPPEAPVS